MRGAALLAAALLAWGCGRSPRVLEGVSVDWTIAEPPAVGPAALTIVLKDAESRPLEGAQLRIEGNMSHAGMQPVFADAEELGRGRYKASLRFTMAGDWVLLISGTLPDGRSIEHRIDVAGVRPTA